MAIPTATAITAMMFWEPPMSEMKAGDEFRALGTRAATARRAAEGGEEADGSRSAHEFVDLSPA